MSSDQLPSVIADKEPYEAPSVRTMTVAEAREQVHASLGDGAECPVCGQLAKAYKRAIRGALCVSLIHIYRYFKAHPEAEWLEDVPGYLRARHANATNDAALLRHWGLIEPRPGVRGDGSTRIGVFRITDLGRSFVRGICGVPRFAVLYNQTLLGLEGDNVGIHEALGIEFNYSDLMAL